jgi:hypothetical protein
MKIEDLLAIVVIGGIVATIIGTIVWTSEGIRDREWKRVQEYGDCKKIGDLVGYNSFEIRTRYLCFDSVEYIR